MFNVNIKYYSKALLPRGTTCMKSLETQTNKVSTYANLSRGISYVMWLKTTPKCPLMS